MKRMDRLHPRPLPTPACFYGEESVYPERIRTSFTDGHVKTYWMETEMPGPNLMSEKEWKRQCRECGGYQYRGDRTGKKTRWIFAGTGWRKKKWLDTMFQRFWSLQRS